MGKPIPYTQQMGLCRTHKSFRHPHTLSFFAGMYAYPLVTGMVTPPTVTLTTSETLMVLLSRPQ